MRIIFKVTLILMFLFNISNASQDGEKVFKQYCWGCHHQTAVAFGPSFEQIANKRTIGEIQGQIISPKSMYKQLGYKRSVMPSFKDELTQKQLDDITDFIMSYKTKKD